MIRSSLLFALLLLSACNRDPLRVTYAGQDQISICRDTRTAEFDEAEDQAARFCSRKGMAPQLAATDRCSSHAVRYDYICRPIWK
jgi:hypothetical protein